LTPDDPRAAARADRPSALLERLLFMVLETALEM
jgi:hypothetical protein